MPIRTFVEWAAQRYKGADYRLDPAIPLRSLVGLAMRRAMSLLRGVVFGRVFSLDPRDWLFLGPGVELRNRALIRFGRGVSVGRGVIIDGLSREGVSFGDGVSVGAYSLIEASGILTDLGRGFRIGSGSAIGAYTFVGAAGGVDIGRNVIMGQRVSFHSENHVFERTDVPIRLQGITRKGIVIENDCWIGAGVIFLDGAHVGTGCVIAAGAVVRGEIPALSVAGGVPAKILKSRT